MKYINNKIIQNILLCSFLLVGFLSSCSYESEDFDPSILQDVPFSGEDEEEEIIPPDTISTRS
ncbi:MAG: hypothetical protein Roseis2KO_42590 [Roseivirga sp.]